jgi:hypothetical protein
VVTGEQPMNTDQRGRGSSRDKGGQRDPVGRLQVGVVHLAA